MEDLLLQCFPKLLGFCLVGFIPNLRGKIEDPSPFVRFKQRALQLLDVVNGPFEALLRCLQLRAKFVEYPKLAQRACVSYEPRDVCLVQTSVVSCSCACLPLSNTF